MAISKDKQKIEEVLTRSVDTIYPTPAAFKKLLSSGKQLRVYNGIDPTATYVHLGHSTNYIFLRRLHDLGHKIIVLIGDFTAMIGDPSDKSAARKQLTKAEVKKNLKTFKKQIGKILPLNDKKNPVEFVFNADWLSKLSFQDAVELASHFTVQRMLERDTFERRIKEQKPLYVHEFFYPLMQGYDTVAINADVEVGGTDQTFNMLAGRTLAKAYQQREKIVVTTTLLENPVTGEKLMSKSLGTGIGLDESPNEMFGKTMALPDEGIMQCFVDCTYLSMGEIDAMCKEMKKGGNPRDYKMRLGYEIVKMYHSEKDAEKAKAHFVKTIVNKEAPDEMKEVKPSTYKIVTVLAESGLVKSTSEARRAVQQGGVKVNDQKVSSIDTKVKKDDVVQKGKRHFVRVA